MKIVIIGNGAAGLSAAESARKQDPNCQIDIYTKENVHTYTKPRLFEVAADAANEAKLYLHDEAWYQERQINIHFNREVLDIDKDNKKITLDKEEVVDYDKLILASGSYSFVPPIKGSDAKNVFTVWTMADMKAFADKLGSDKKVVVIGGGLLGLEGAWQVSRGGSKTTVLESFDRLLGRQMDEEGSSLFKAKVESLGIDVFLKANTKEIQVNEAGEVKGILLEDGREIPCDVVLLSCGVRAETTLADKIGLEKGIRIKVDAGMKTSDDNIYACGDNVELDGQWFGLWAISQGEGKVAGENAAGGSARYEMPVQPYLLATMDTKVMSVGLVMEAEGMRVDKQINPDEFTYRKLIYQGDDLKGFIIMGDTKEGMQLRKLIK